MYENQLIENATTVERLVRDSERKKAMYRRAATAMKSWHSNRIPRTTRLRAESTEIMDEENFWNGFPGEDEIYVDDY